MKLQGKQKGVEEEYTLQAAIDSSKKALIEGSSDVLQVKILHTPSLDKQPK